MADAFVGVLGQHLRQNELPNASRREDRIAITDRDDNQQTKSRQHMISKEFCSQSRDRNEILYYIPTLQRPVKH